MKLAKSSLENPRMSKIMTPVKRNACLLVIALSFVGTASYAEDGHKRFGFLPAKKRVLISQENQDIRVPATPPDPAEPPQSSTRSLAPPTQIPYPPDRLKAPERLVAPPGENPYFPIRRDGQPFVLDQDLTPNMTNTINKSRYWPKYEGLVRSDFDAYSIIGREQRNMASWPEVNEFSVYRVFTKMHKAFERWMGFDPYETK